MKEIVAVSAVPEIRYQAAGHKLLCLLVSIPVSSTKRVTLLTRTRVVWLCTSLLRSYRGMFSIEIRFQGVRIANQVRHQYRNDGVAHQTSRLPDLCFGINLLFEIP